MPIREYQAGDPAGGCAFCRNGFERFERGSGPVVLKCPQCGAKIVRLISAPNVGASQSNADARAKQAGFHKLKKISRGEYEKIY
ncbi:MAG: zinc ribbon domain-containing protein [Kiritimatiellae bacterium]|jgi:putative FmdB family regulatory protein|nr:zinc ribbon domain-containing protein [Kiritimatiellia bacterium]